MMMSVLLSSLLNHWSLERLVTSKKLKKQLAFFVPAITLLFFENNWTSLELLLITTFSIVSIFTTGFSGVGLFVLFLFSKNLLEIGTLSEFFALFFGIKLLALSLSSLSDKILKQAKNYLLLGVGTTVFSLLLISTSGTGLYYHEIVEQGSMGLLKSGQYLFLFSLLFSSGWVGTSFFYPSSESASRESNKLVIFFVEAFVAPFLVLSCFWGLFENSYTMMSPVFTLIVGGIVVASNLFTYFRKAGGVSSLAILLMNNFNIFFIGLVVGVTSKAVIGVLIFCNIALYHVLLKRNGSWVLKYIYLGLPLSPYFIFITYSVNKIVVKYGVLHGLPFLLLAMVPFYLGCRIFNLEKNGKV